MAWCIVSPSVFVMGLDEQMLRHDSAHVYIFISYQCALRNIKRYFLRNVQNRCALRESRAGAAERL
jgi:hypothetical protein